MPGDATDSEKATQLLSGLRRRRPEMLRVLARFVRAESPTDAKAAVDRFGRIVAAEWRKRGARVHVLHQRRQGDHLRVVWPGQASRGRQILVLGHLDTVYE